MNNTPQATAPSEPTSIRVSVLPIRLGQFLKHIGIVENGVDAKMKIRNGEIQVNGQCETRRGRHLDAGDIVHASGATYIIASAADDL